MIGTIEEFRSLIREELRRVLREEGRGREQVDADPHRLLSYGEAGEIAHVSKETIGDWVKRKFLRRYGGRPPLVKASELMDYLANPRPRGGPKTAEQRANEILGARHG